MLKMFSVYDSKAKAYITPFFLPEVGMAIREFEFVANEPEHMFCRFSADYTLFLIGDFDASTGSVNSLEHPENLGIASSFKRNYVATNVNPEDEGSN